MEQLTNHPYHHRNHITVEYNASSHTAANLHEFRLDSCNCSQYSSIFPRASLCGHGRLELAKTSVPARPVFVAACVSSTTNSSFQTATQVFAELNSHEQQTSTAWKLEEEETACFTASLQDLNIYCCTAPPHLDTFSVMYLCKFSQETKVHLSSTYAIYAQNSFLHGLGKTY